MGGLQLACTPEDEVGIEWWLSGGRYVTPISVTDATVTYKFAAGDETVAERAEVWSKRYSLVVPKDGTDLLELLQRYEEGHILSLVVAADGGRRDSARFDPDGAAYAIRWLEDHCATGGLTP